MTTSFTTVFLIAFFDGGGKIVFDILSSTLFFTACVDGGTGFGLAFGRPTEAAGRPATPVNAFFSFYVRTSHFMKLPTGRTKVIVAIMR